MLGATLVAVPVQSPVAAGFAVEGVDCPRERTGQIIPLPAGKIRSGAQSLKQGLAITIVCMARKIRLVPFTKVCHWTTAADQPALALPSGVNRSSDELQEALRSQTDFRPIVFIAYRFIARCIQTWNAVGKAADCVFVSHHPKFGILRECRAAGAQALVASLNIAVRVERKRLYRAAGGAVGRLRIIGIKSNRLSARLARPDDVCPDAKAEDVFLLAIAKIAMTASAIVRSKPCGSCKQRKRNPQFRKSLVAVHTRPPT